MVGVAGSVREPENRGGLHGTHLEKVDDELGVHVEVVLDGLVEDVHGGALDCHILEADVLPRDSVVRHHRVERVVELIIPEEHSTVNILATFACAVSNSRYLKSTQL